MILALGYVAGAVFCIALGNRSYRAAGAAFAVALAASVAHVMGAP